MFFKLVFIKKVLRDAGIVRGDKRGYYTHYYVDREILKQAADQILKLSKVIPLGNKCYQDCSSNNTYYSKKEVNQDES
jgi:hypothetical protein